MLKINRIKKNIQMETFLSNNEIINNLCYDGDWLDIYSISVQPVPLAVAVGDKASVLLQ